MDDKQLEEWLAAEKERQLTKAWGNPGSAFLSSLVDQAGGLAGVAGHYSGNNTVRNLGDKLYAYANEIKPQGNTEFEKAANAAGQYFFPGAVALGTKSPKLALAMDALQETGATINQLRAMGIPEEEINNMANRALITNGAGAVANAIAGNVVKGKLTGFAPKDAKVKIAKVLGYPLTFLTDEPLQNLTNDEIVKMAKRKQE